MTSARNFRVHSTNRRRRRPVEHVDRALHVRIDPVLQCTCTVLAAEVPARERCPSNTSARDGSVQESSLSANHVHTRTV